MMILKSAPRRSGAATMEAAIVLPVFLFLVLALIIGGMGILRYQEVCFLAREGSRYAAVHGSDYARETNQTAATTQDIYDTAIAPRIVGLEAANLSYSVTLTLNGTTVPWDNSTKAPYTVLTNYSTPRGSVVNVTVTYQWFPELYLVGPITFSSTSSLPMSY